MFDVILANWAETVCQCILQFNEWWIVCFGYKGAFDGNCWYGAEWRIEYGSTCLHKFT